MIPFSGAVGVFNQGLIAVLADAEHDAFFVFGCIDYPTTGLAMTLKRGYCHDGF
jgi:hypothetical protein